MYLNVVEKVRNNVSHKKDLAKTYFFLASKGVSTSFEVRIGNISTLMRFLLSMGWLGPLLQRFEGCSRLGASAVMAV